MTSDQPAILFPLLIENRIRSYLIRPITTLTEAAQILQSDQASHLIIRNRHGKLIPFRFHPKAEIIGNCRCCYDGLEWLRDDQEHPDYVLENRTWNQFYTHQALPETIDFVLRLKSSIHCRLDNHLPCNLYLSHLLPSNTANHQILGNPTPKPIKAGLTSLSNWCHRNQYLVYTGWFAVLSTIIYRTLTTQPKS